jgi:RNA polymerase sigma-70 factor (ECF subfamily)
MKTSRKQKKAKFSVNDIKDLKTLEDIKAGNVHAYEFIYNRYFRYIQYHCFMSIKDQQIADDLTVEILTKIYLNLDKYSVNYTFNSWVWSIAKNYVVDYIRKNKIEPVNHNRNSVIAAQESREDDGITSTVYSNQLDSGDLNPEELMQQRSMVNIRKEFVQNLLSNISERERMILIHYYFDEMSYDEIAAKLNIGLSAMKVTLLRTKEKLRNKIGDISNISHLLAV